MSSSPFPTPHSLFPARCSCPLKSPMLRFAAIITLHQFNPISFEHFGLGGLRAKETLYCEEGLRRDHYRFGGIGRDGRERTLRARARGADPRSRAETGADARFRDERVRL